MLLLSIFYFGSTLVVFLFCSRLMIKRGGFVLTPFFVFSLNEIIWTWPATIYAQDIGISDAYPAILVSTAFLAFLSGFFFTIDFLRLKLSRIQVFRESPFKIKGQEDIYFKSMLFFSVLLTVSGIYLYQGLPPLLDVVRDIISSRGLSSSISALSNIKEDITKSYYFGGAYRGQGMLLRIQETGWLYVATMAVILYKMTRTSLWFIASLVLIILSILFIGGVGQRGPIMNIFVYFLIFFSLIIRLNFMHIVLTMSLFFLLLFFVGPLSAQILGLEASENILLDVLSSVFKRILLGNGIHNIDLMNFINSGALQYGYGRYHLEKILTALPGVTVGVPLSRQLQELLTAGLDDTTFASMTYFGIIYADFGTLGVIVGYVLMGITTGLAHKYLFRIKKSVVAFPVMVFVIYSFGNLPQSSAVAILASLLVLILFYFFINASLKIQMIFSRPTRHV